MDDSTDLHALIDELRREIAALREENKQLRRRLGLNSSNNSKPPSSDGPGRKSNTNKPSPKSLRSKSGKKSGGQKGHKGATLSQTETPDKTERHTVQACHHCQAKLSASHVIRVDKRQVFDIPPPKLEVTEHQAEIARCSCCGKTTKAAFPEGVNAAAQYGPRIKAAAIYLNVQQFIPEDRTSTVLADLFAALTLCPATITRWAARKAQELEPVVEAIKECLTRAPVRHLDETGFRIAGRTQWLHTVSTNSATYYVTSEKRGDIPNFHHDQGGGGGVIVHDHFKPYYSKFTDVLHALCNAHHLRELKALMEHDEEPWAFEMYDFLCIANNLVEQAHAKNMSGLPPPLLKELHALYDCLVDDGFALSPCLATACHGCTWCQETASWSQSVATAA